MHIDCPSSLSVSAVLGSKQDIEEGEILFLKLVIKIFYISAGYFVREAEKQAKLQE